MSKLLKELNSSQQEAVTHEAGPLLIIAGPGSGKTQTVAHSIAYAIKASEVLPNRIAAFTFGRKAKDDLIDRVRKIMGNKLANDIWISTFHSFCGSVVKEVLDSFRTNEGRIRAEINLTQHHIFPENTEEYVIDPHYIDTLKDTLKKSGQLVDDDNPFTKVQLSTYALFRDVPEVKKKWQEKFDLIFVDEYQDTDHVQHKIIKALVERHQNLRVVGDDDQGIYGWRDADIQNILDFEKNYPNAKVISLGQNYRSTRQIVNASRALIDFNPDRREKKIFTNNPEGDKVKHLHCEDREAEASTIAGFISRAIHIQSGWTADDFVVLCRSTDQQAAPFKEAFDNSGILSHVVESSSDMHANSVSIMTIHKSKGLEFKNVFVAGVCSGLLPDYRSKEEDWDEELRLLYVAMTRAENWLCLSSYEKDSSDKNTSFKRGPSRFLDFMPQSLVERIKTLDNTAIPSRVKKAEDKGEDTEKSPKDATSSPIRHQTVLGIDPGKENVGWSITKRLSDRYTCKYGNERPAGQPIERKINELIMEYSPDAISVEKLEGAKDEWFLHVAGCVAQIGSIADQQDIECHFYSPQDVKYAVTGNKRASKGEVQQAVKQVCNLKEIPEPHHSADAIATSLCYLRNYLNYSRFQNNARMKEHYDSGTAYLGIRQYNEAIVEFEKAINNSPMIDPMYTKAHCGLARAYLGLVKLEEAENSAIEALRIDDNYQPARALLRDIKQSHVNRGKDYLKQDELVSAERSAREAQRLDPNCQEADALLKGIKQAYYIRGRNHLENRRYDEAIATFEETINKYPSFIEAHCGLARAYLEQDKLIEAERTVKEALRPNDEHPFALQVLEDIKQKYYERGMSYLEQEDLVSAENQAREVLRLDHQLAHHLLEAIKQTYYNRGCDHLDNRRYDEAITAFEETINKYPSFIEAHCGLARAYLEQDKLLEAEKAAKEALRPDDEHPFALQVWKDIKQKYYERGISSLEQGDLVSAEVSANKVLSLDPKYQLAHELLEAIKQAYINKGDDCLRRAELETAKKAVEEALRFDPSYQPTLELLEKIKQAYYNRGRDHLDNRRYDEAIFAFKETIKKYSSFIEAYCGLARAYLGKGNWVMAGRSVRSAYDLDPNSRDVLQLMETTKRRHCELGRDYLNQGNLSAAEKSTNEARRLDENYQPALNLLKDIKQAYYNRSCNYLDNLQYIEAITAFGETINRYPKFAAAHCGLGQTYLRKGDLTKAADSAKKALRLDPHYQPALNLLEDIKQTYYNQGCDHLDNQRYGEAIHIFTKTINKYPDFTKAHYRLAQAYFEQGDDLVAAEESIKETLKLDPNYQPAHALLRDIKREYHNRGIVHIETGEYNKAINLLLKGYNIDPKDKQLCMDIGDAYCLMNDYANAARWYQKVTEIAPNDKIAYIELGNAYYNTGKYEKSIDSFEKARTLDPHCEKTYDSWQRADFKLQKDKEMKADRMIRIPAEKFQMKSKDRESKDCENLEYTVYVDEFYIDAYLVTNAQYKVFAEKNPEWQKSCISNRYHRGDYLMDWNGNNYPQGKDNHPVTYVNWYAAMAYALWIGKRLPTEVEWEKASCEFGDTVLAGNHPSSVWEWCLDEYNRSFPCPNPIVGADNTDEIINNFKNIKTSRVVRMVRDTNRRGNSPLFTNFNYGFRCVSSGTD